MLRENADLGARRVGLGARRAISLGLAAAMTALSPGYGAYSAFAAVVIRVPAKVAAPAVRVQAGMPSSAPFGLSQSGLSASPGVSLPAAAFEAAVAENGASPAAFVQSPPAVLPAQAGAENSGAAAPLPASPGRGGKAGRTVLERLGDSVGSLPKAMELKGAQLKSAAGKDFDNSVSGNGADPTVSGRETGLSRGLEFSGGLRPAAADAPGVFPGSPIEKSRAGGRQGSAYYVRSESWFYPAPGPTQARLGWAYRLQKKAASAVMMLSAALPFLNIPQPSAPRMTSGDLQALVDYYRANKPSLVLMDWDNTFMDNRMGQNDKAREEHYEILRALRAAGIRAGFVTNRPFLGEGYGMEDLLMKGMPADIRSGFLLGVGGGAEVYEYGPDGEAPAEPTMKMSFISDADRAAMRAALRETAAGLGIDVSEGTQDFFDQGEKSYEYAFILKKHRRQIEPLYEGLMAKMKALGIADKYKFQLKMPVNADLEPYIRVRVLGAVKANGVRGILDVLKRDGVEVKPEDVLFFGDEFNPGNDDISMARSLPTGTAIAVGKAADPRVRNAHLTPGVGPDSTLAFLWDMLGEKPRTGTAGFAFLHKTVVGMEAVGGAFSGRGAELSLRSDAPSPAEARENKLPLEDALYFHETMSVVRKFLDGFVHDNSGWWGRFTGKRRIAEMARLAFLQEIEQGRKPAFDITVKEDGVKKALRGPNGETVAEILWSQLKLQNGLTEHQLERFLEIAGRIHALRKKYGEPKPFGGPAFSAGAAADGFAARALLRRR